MQTKKLKQHLDVLKLTANVKSTINPVLANVALSGDMVTTDLEHWTIVREGIAPGMQGITAPLSALEKLAKNVSADSIQFAEKIEGENKVILMAQAGKLKNNLVGLPMEEFPQVPAIPSEYQVEFTAPQFFEIVNKLSASVADYYHNNVLAGYSFLFSPKGSEIVTVDGSRLGKFELPELVTPFESQIIIPGYILVKIAAKLKKSEERVILAFSDAKPDGSNYGLKFEHVAVRVGEYEFLLRRIEGQFPKYNQLIPYHRDLKSQFNIDKKKILAALKEISPFLNDRTRIVRMTFANGELTLAGSIPDCSDTETATEYTDITNVGESLNINFNADFLKDGIDNTEGDTVRFAVNGPLNPAIIRSEKPMALDYTYLIMPVQVK